MRLFAEPLIRGAIEHRDAIDEHIKKVAKNWDLHRIARWTGTFSGSRFTDAVSRGHSAVVSINEAVDIAKSFRPGQRQVCQRHPRQSEEELMRPARIIKG